ncbi:MAG: cytochrome c oxidase assembly protein [Methyloprofundus sp.]|nr:cytochrome c oxidase assembly protein [Methyloprofundus sp.]MDT8425123.1 cytochrome c oxidase assembly protein [Methyloprofundus sp.]
MSVELEQKNKKTVRALVLLVFVMFLFAVALIPLYDILCDITGINGKTKQDSTVLNYTIDTQREITLEFITSLGAGTNLGFKADKYEIKVHPGEVINMGFTVSNKTDQRMAAKANPSVTPGPSVGYVKNTECFCFDTQVFEAGETKHLEVQLVINPALPEHYKRLTFGLTFFDTTN